MTMLQQLPQIETVSALKHRYIEVMQRLDAGPVVLTRNAKPVAVLLSPADWDRLIDELEMLRETATSVGAVIAPARYGQA